ncbi:hypothetical protein [Aeromicrobium sp. UC242_57]|uniref:hypothetical protein n=1 Tax=Aeromicrobium sp. UC242_57 TaxID=3374624 RepID=UPI0037B2E42D
MSDEQAARPRGPLAMQYARIAVPDMQDTIEFLTYHVGLQLEQHDEAHAYLRADIAHHNIETAARAAPHRVRDGRRRLLGRVGRDAGRPASPGGGSGPRGHRARREDAESCAQRASPSLTRTA